MSDFNKPKSCINECGAVIYFDPNSTVGHPTRDKWLALEVKEGRKTDVVHNCPKKKQNDSSSLTGATAATTLSKLESLDFAEYLCDLLQDYIRLKLLEAKESKK